MIEELRSNLDIEIDLTRQLIDHFEKLEYGSSSEKRMFTEIIGTLQKKIIIINNSIPVILNKISITKKLPSNIKEKEKIEQVKLTDGQTSSKIYIRKEDRKKFLRQLNIKENLLKKVKKRSLHKDTDVHVYKGASFYGKLSNRFFFKISDTTLKKGYFKSLALDIRRSNMNVLTSTYISMMFFSIVLSIIFMFLFMVFFLIFNISSAPPIISFFDGSYISRLTTLFWIGILFPILTWAGFYFYPSSEMKSLAKKIEHELPFAVVHMGSIAGSGIEPIKIFKIVGLSKEYPHASKEIKKIINQTNIYGYDLTTSLRNVARATPSPKLSELLNGLSITISSGGDIKSFFEKRAESLLLEYRLEREKYTKSAETFMDIYISIVIAAPMILLLLLVMISVSGIQIGLGISQLSIVIVGAVALINLIFLAFLQLKQPKY